MEAMTEQEMRERVRLEKKRVASEMEAEPKHEFEFILTDEKRLDRLIMKMMYNKEEPSGFGTMPKPGLNCAYGVKDKENRIFLTLCGYTSQSIKRTYDGTDNYNFAVLLNGAYQFHSMNLDIAGIVYCKAETCSDVPLFMSIGRFGTSRAEDSAAAECSVLIRQAIRYYLDDRKVSAFEKSFEAETSKKMHEYKRECFKEAYRKYARMWGKDI